MSESCFYKNYCGPEFNGSNCDARYLMKFRRNIGSRAVKTSIDGIDKYFVQSLRLDAPPSPPISDFEYYRLHDILYDTDLAFEASLFERWAMRAERLAPWTPEERKILMQRWFSRVSRMTKLERLLFVDSSVLTSLMAKPFSNMINLADEATNVENMEVSDQGEASRDNVQAFKNSDGQIDSTLCPKLIHLWEIRANRTTPFPREVADKLLTAWLGHESTWTDDERIIFYAVHDPTVELTDQVSADEKRRLLDILVASREDGAEPLLNGRYVKECEPEGMTDVTDEEVFSTTGAESQPVISDYKKELEQFLASDRSQHVKLIKEAFGKNQRLMQLLESDDVVETNSIRQAIFPGSPLEFSFHRCGC